MYKQIGEYFKKHYHFNAFAHLFAGLGLGILATYPLVGTHPIRWAAALLAVSVLMHLYPLLVKK